MTPAATKRKRSLKLCAHCKRQIQFVKNQKQWIHSGFGSSVYCNYNTLKRATPKAA